MIKLNHLSVSSMDLVMGLSREFNETPEYVVKVLLGSLKYKEAKRAIDEYKKGYKKPTKK